MNNMNNMNNMSKAITGGAGQIKAAVKQTTLNPFKKKRKFAKNLNSSTRY